MFHSFDAKLEHASLFWLKGFADALPGLVLNTLKGYVSLLKLEVTSGNNG